MTCEVAEVNVAEQVACPVAAVMVTAVQPLMAVPLSVKLTVPLEESATGLVGVTEAVKVACWFTPVAADEVTVTAVLALFTVCEKAVLALEAKVVASPE